MYRRKEGRKASLRKKMSIWSWVNARVHKAGPI